MRQAVKYRQAWEASLPSCVSICRYFPAFQAAVWKAIYFRTCQDRVPAAEWIITSIKVRSARGQWIFGVTTYIVLSSLNVCRFFSPLSLCVCVCVCMYTYMKCHFGPAVRSSGEQPGGLVVVVGLEVWQGLVATGDVLLSLGQDLESLGVGLQTLWHQRCYVWLILSM